MFLPNARARPSCADLLLKGVGLLAVEGAQISDGSPSDQTTHHRASGFPAMWCCKTGVEAQELGLGGAEARATSLTSLRGDHNASSSARSPTPRTEAPWRRPMNRVTPRRPLYKQRFDLAPSHAVSASKGQSASGHDSSPHATVQAHGWPCAAWRRPHASTKAAGWPTE